MAIDLCNKTELMQSAPNLPAWESYNDEDVDDCHSPLGALEPVQRAGLEIGYQSSLCKVDPRYVIGDPAAWVSDFGYAVDLVAQRLDPRPNDLLTRVALEDPDPAMREQAAYEYADRNPSDACELLCEVARRDPNREVRWDALWAIEKLGGCRHCRPCAASAGTPIPRSPSGPACSSASCRPATPPSTSALPVDPGSHVRRDDLPVDPL